MQANAIFVTLQYLQLAMYKCTASTTWLRTMALHQTGHGSMDHMSNAAAVVASCSGELHCVSKKVPTFKLSVTLSNHNRIFKIFALLETV